MFTIPNKFKKVVGFIVLFAGIGINQILVNRINTPFFNINNHRIISSVLEVALLIVGGLLAFAPESITFSNLLKKKKIIGISLIAAVLIFNPLVLNHFIFKDLKIESIKYIAISVAEVIFLTLGFIFLLRPEISILKSIASKKKEILLLVVVLIITDFSLSFVVPQKYRVAYKYGWRTTPNTTFTKSIEDKPGVTRSLTITYYENGFRRWGDVSTNKKKVLILGDSYTQDEFVSNGEEWYAYLEKAYPNAEFFVYGSNNFGSLQEYMVLDDYIDQIDPDIVLWQFCGNDFRNNYYPFEKAFYGLSNLNSRPYLEGDKVIYRSTAIFSLLRKYSAISDKLLFMYDQELYHRKNTVKPVVSQKIQDEAFKVTEKIMEMVKEKVGQREMYMFSAYAFTAQERELCKVAKLNCIETIRETVAAASTKENPVYPVNNDHWNLKGNKIVGEALVRYFNGKNVFWK